MKKNITKSTNKIAFPVVLPGPVTGQTLSAQRILKTVELQFGSMSVVHLAIFSRVCRFRLANHAVKFISTLVAAVRLWFCGCNSVYLCPNSSMGQFTDILFVLIAPRKKRYYFHHLSGSYLQRPTFLSRMFFFLLPKHSQHIVSCSYFERQIIKLYGSGFQINLLPLAFIAEPCFQSDNRSWVVGHMSNLCVTKGLGRVLEFADEAKNNNIRLRFAGPVSDTESNILLHGAMNRHDNVEYWGPVYGERKSAYFAGLSIFAFPSLYPNETWGIVVSEAMSGGIPCCVSDAPGVKEQVEDSYVWPSDGSMGSFKSFLAQKMDRFMNEPDFYLNERIRVRERFERNYMKSQKALEKLVRRMYEGN